jgi:cell division protein FtsL
LIKLNASNSMFMVVVLLIVGLFLYFPKIYLRSNIYYVSKDINRLYSHYISLQEENIFLAQQLEDMKFKNQIMDSLLFNPLDKLNNKNLNNNTVEKLDDKIAD